MKITKRQFKAALNVAYEAGFDAGRVLQYAPTKVVKRIVKHEVKHAKMRKLKNVREHWNVAADYVVNLRGELGVGKSAPVRKQVKLPYKPVMEIDDSWGSLDSNTLSDLLAEFDLTSTTSDNNESNASKLNETPTKEDV